MIDPIESLPLGTKRPAHQRWLFFLFETPYSTELKDFSQYDGFFNLTATYRADSDFLTTYEATAEMTWQESDDNDDPVILNDTNKTGFAVAIISNCGSDKNRRLEYIKELGKFISIDMYGGCGSKKCPSNADCKEFLADKYKFFLAFENSFCKGYVTEKFFEILKFNMIPIVLGGGNYEDFVRKNSVF
jgi:hypothetical protein